MGHALKRELVFHEGKPPKRPETWMMLRAGSGVEFHEGKPPKRPETISTTAMARSTGFTRASRRSGLRQ